METAGASRSFLLRDNVVVRLVAYYVAALGFFWALELAFPQIVVYLEIERRHEVRGLQGPAAEPLEEIPTREEARDLAGPDRILRADRSVPVVVSMLGSLALALPVAWVYTWTRPNSKSRQQVAQALIILPIAIALVVFLVKGSLALAFSLAGIVAAIRWRTSLSDTADAVYFLVAIGLGLAAGVQLLSVALIASVFFNTVALFVWNTQFGASPSRLVGMHLQPMTPEDWGSPADSGVTSWPGTTSVDAAPPEHVFLVEADDADHGERLAELVFAQHGKQWRLNRTTQSPAGPHTLEFSVRLKKRTDPSVVAKAIEEAGGGGIGKVETLGAGQKSSG